MADIRMVLFDLDGTLIDTAPDMALALDNLCREQNQLLIPFDSVRPIVSDGSVALVKLAFGDDLDHERLEALKQRYLEIYRQTLALHSKPFDEIIDLLDTFDKNDIKWGVVTNKPGWLTEPLLRELGLDHRAACIVSGDSTQNRKPHPEPMHHACRLAGAQAEQCMYVGDARRDIEAGKNAGMNTLVALYGYIKDEEDCSTWDADACIERPSEILQYI